MCLWFYKRPYKVNEFIQSSSFCIRNKGHKSWGPNLCSENVQKSKSLLIDIFPFDKIIYFICFHLVWWDLRLVSFKTPEEDLWRGEGVVVCSIFSSLSKQTCEEKMFLFISPCLYTRCKIFNIHKKVMNSSLTNDSFRDSLNLRVWVT